MWEFFRKVREAWREAKEMYRAVLAEVEMEKLRMIEASPEPEVTHYADSDLSDIVAFKLPLVLCDRKDRTMKASNAWEFVNCVDCRKRRFKGSA